MSEPMRSLLPRHGRPLLRPMLRLAVGALAIAGVVLVSQGAWIKAKAALSQVLLERSFDRGLQQPPPAPLPAIGQPGLDQVSLEPPASSADAAQRPWPWADFATLARISAPRLGLSDIVLDRASGEALAFGPGHVLGTPLPGEDGTSVMAGHRDTHFAWLRELQPGDRVTVTLRDGRTLPYVMRRAFIARHDATGIDPYAPGQYLALTTCWPFDAKTPGPLRYIAELQREDMLRTAAN